MVKILFVTSFLGKEYGGAEISTRLLLDKLRVQGFDVHALTTRKVEGDELLIPISFLFEVPKRILTLGNRQIDFFLARKIRQKIERERPDVIHVQDTYVLPATVAANRNLGLPVLVTIRNSVLDQTWDVMFPFPISYLLKRRNKVIIRALGEVDGVIAISQYVRSELIQVGVKDTVVSQIYNLPPKIEQETADSPKDASLLHSDDPVVHFFAPGCLMKFKGFSVLINAFKEVIDSGSNADLVIAGDGQERKSLERLTKTLELEKYVKFVGRVPFKKISELYSTCDVVIFPSIYPEPLGRVALEAMFFGKPVVASKVGGIPEMVKENVTGLLVNPNDPHELAKSILTLANNKELRVSMGEKGKLTISSQFNSEKILEQHLQAYQACCLKRDKSS